MIESLADKTNFTKQYDFCFAARVELHFYLDRLFTKRSLTELGNFATCQVNELYSIVTMLPIITLLQFYCLQNAQSPDVSKWLRQMKS